jgi:hypothetical protein
MIDDDDECGVVDAMRIGSGNSEKTCPSDTLSAINPT